MGEAAGQIQSTPQDGGPAFGPAVAFVLSLEGGRVVDQGGDTNLGISSNANPDVDLDRLDHVRAIQLYRERYWQPVRGAALPPALALVVFDGAVNMGVAQAVKLLQRVLRVEVDGVMGPLTVAAAKSFVPTRELVAQYLDARLSFYRAIAAANPERHGASLHGWQMRLWRLAQEAGRDVWRSLSSTRELSR